LLSCLAYWGADDVEQAKEAFELGRSKLKGAEALSSSPVESCGLDAVEDSLRQLEALSPLLKRQIISACTACVGADGRVTVEEAELLRAVADSLDCPLPPFLPTQAAA
jgi:hypothetical protein